MNVKNEKLTVRIKRNKHDSNAIIGYLEDQIIILDLKFCEDKTIEKLISENNQERAADPLSTGTDLVYTLTSSV